METLMDLYNSVQSPLDDLDKVKKIIEVYSKSDKDGKDFYKNLVHLSDKKYDGRTSQESVDLLNSMLFNLWKANIVEMNADKYKNFYSGKGNYQDNDFQKLRKQLSLIDDVSTEEEVENIINQFKDNPQFSEAYKKYKYTVNQGSLFDKWLYVDSAKLGQRPTNNAQHRLYLNVERPYIENMLLLLLTEADKRNMEFTLKYSNVGARDDTIVIYANDTNVLQYIEILKGFREKYPIFNSEIYSPPIMTGTIDGWIGYGAEPTITINKEQQSYTSLREKIIKEAISRVYSDWLSSHGGVKNLSEYEIAERDSGFIQAIRDEIIRVSKEYEIDENNFCFDTKTVQQMKQTDAKLNQSSQQQISNTPIEETKYKETIALSDELLQKPGIDWEDLLEKEDDKQTPSNKFSLETEEINDLEAVLAELNKIGENDEKRKAQKQVVWRKKFDKRDKDYYKKAEAYLLGELKRLSPEERKRGNQYLSALEQEQDRNK